MSKSHRYWLAKAGSEYRGQQRLRSEGGSTSYSDQEAWLSAYLETLSSRLQRPIRVLDFGCGFGRFAHLLAGRVEVEYFGYDFSRSMVSELLEDPPESLVPVERHVRVAAQLQDAFPDSQFDVIFTVSVLIHNSPEDARGLLEQMTAALASGGRIILVENALSALSVRENSWHAGCWLHDVAGVLATDFDIEVHPDAISEHCAYVLSPAEGRDRQLTWQSHGELPRQTTLEELHLAGLPRLALGLRGMEDELRAHEESVGSAHDEAEILRGELTRMRHESVDAEALSAQVAALNGELSFRKGLRRVLGEARAELSRNHAGGAVRNHPAPRAESPAAFEFDSALDLRFTNHDDRFGPVAQVFHQEWFGIRAACGSLPGAKLAISARRPATESELEEIVDICRERGIDRMVLHGMSDSMYGFACAMHQAGIDLYVVWHGAAAMWMMEAERKFFELAAGLLARGVIKRLHTIRQGTDVALGDHPRYGSQLLNAVPNIRIARAAPRKSDSAIAFSPSWNLLHKNLATNLAAAAASARVGTIWAMADDAVMVSARHKHFERLRPQKQDEIIQTMSCADIVLNVSLVDCHPMVDLEALAAGTPCVRGRLFLDALEDHPYVRVTEVENMLSVAAVMDVIDRVLATPAVEMDSMMGDYASAITRVAIARYAEFLELG